jgi:hypothetical protein
MLADGFTYTLPPPIPRGTAASAEDENPRLYLPIASADVLFELLRAGSTRVSATDAIHPRLNSHA